MSWKQEITEYEDKVLEIDKKIQSEAKKAWRQIQSDADKMNTESEQDAQKENEAPCTVCGKTDFVLKYREVVGKIEGKTYGSFSLFGGSIYGYVDGDISTKPVLSCRECENERLIEIGDHTVDYVLLERQMPTVIGSDYFRPATYWLKDKGIEVARCLGKHLFLPKDYHDIEEMTDYELKRCGLEFKYTYPQKPRFYLFKKWWVT